VYARVELFPFEHVFRKRSSFRITIDSAMGRVESTGLWGLTGPRTPFTDTIYADPSHRSQVVFGLILRSHREGTAAHLRHHHREAMPTEHRTRARRPAHPAWRLVRTLKPVVIVGARLHGSPVCDRWIAIHP
jgi:hypothetical protein